MRLASPILTVVLLAGSGSELFAQRQCSSAAVRGVYAVVHEGWVDPAKIFPPMPRAPPAEPTLVPLRGVSRFVADGRGGGSGQITASIGGVAMTLEYVDLHDEVKPDCRAEVSFALGGPGLPGPIFQQKHACIVELSGQESVCTLASPPGSAVNTTLERIGRPGDFF